MRGHIWGFVWFCIWFTRLFLCYKKYFQELGQHLPSPSYSYIAICNRSAARVTTVGQEQKQERRGSRSLSTAQARAPGQSRARQVMMMLITVCSLPFAVCCLIFAVSCLLCCWAVDRFFPAGMAGKFGGMRMDGEGAAHKKRSVFSYLLWKLLNCENWAPAFGGLMYTLFWYYFVYYWSSCCLSGITIIKILHQDSWRASHGLCLQTWRKGGKADWTIQGNQLY